MTSCLGNLILIFTEKKKKLYLTRTKKSSWEKKLKKETVDNKHGTLNLNFEAFNTFFYGWGLFLRHLKRVNK